MVQFSRSRLVRKEEARSIRRAFFYSLLSITLIILLVFLGIPLLVKVATFFTQWQESKAPVETTDNLAPAPPQINTIPRATPKELLSLSGMAEPGATIEVFLNNTSVEKVVTTNEGTFTVDRLQLTLGENKIHTIAIDQAGNASQASSSKTILYDNKPPELEITAPQDGKVFSGEKQKKITISGKTEPEATLTINDRLIILDQSGAFSAQQALNEGENEVRIVATDLAENKTEKEIKVTYAP